MAVITQLQAIPLSYQVPCILFVIVCLLLILRLAVWVHEYFYPAAVEILYDNGKYNGLETIKIKSFYDEFKTLFAYRVKISNNTNNLITKVEVLIEGNLLETPSRAYFTKFKNTHEYLCDIYPKSDEIVTLCHKDLKSDELTTLTIKCRGKEIREIIKTITL